MIGRQKAGVLPLRQRLPGRRARFLGPNPIADHHLHQVLVFQALPLQPLDLRDSHASTSSSVKAWRLRRASCRANDSGKSTIFRYLQPMGDFINADVVARGINSTSPESASMAAGRRVLNRLDMVITDRQNFVYVTTLSSQQSSARPVPTPPPDRYKNSALGW